ncbi:MAG: hypothetical protein L0Z50_12750 [Verrucomicrobiales bacterium]|nr:hypothetical protein [Verrucomicrobiales bacterium]
MKFEMAATDASQNQPMQAGSEAAPGSVSRPAPVAAKLEVTAWFVTDFELPITVLHERTTLRLLTLALSSFEEERGRNLTVPNT